MAISVVTKNSNCACTRLVGILTGNYVKNFSLSAASSQLLTATYVASTESVAPKEGAKMKKVNTRFLALAAAIILVGGVAIFSTNSFASDSTTTSAPSVTPAFVPTITTGTVSAPAVSGKSDVAETGDVVDSELVTGSTDVASAEDSEDGQSGVTTTDIAQAGDLVDLLPLPSSASK